ncbi:MAG: 23S rRNA (uracil(1939)-C(5))-methyltransferase RlmD [Flavobacteriaceae bacterium]|nr:23S rRNA (uracil(1939)-C(5))-methyltransferase RlmD [Flavobacteriaceae bacterium]
MARKKRKQIFEQLEVIDAGAKGKAVAKAPDGRVVFLKNAVPGDIVDVETYKKRKSFYEGNVLTIHKGSERRVEPSCKHFGLCGGCKWQNMDYESQLFFKQKEVEQNLRRIGHLEYPELLPIIASEDIFFYRNKMEFSFSNNRWLTSEELNSDQEFSNKNALGFHIPGRWDKILDIDKCWLQADPSNAIRNFTRSFAVENKLSFFDLREQKGLLRNLMIRTTSIDEIMVLVQFFDDDQSERESLLDALIENFPEITSLLYVINQKANDTIYDQEVICYNGRDHILEKMEGLTFKINAKSFYQTNSKQAFKLYDVARDFAQLTSEELVYDLYSGTGTIALFLAKQAKHIIGVESVPDAVVAAKENAQFNGVDNVEFVVGDMKTVLDETFVDKHGQPDVIITDPPRDGMHQKVVEEILRIRAGRIVYVSCNSATQARDLALLNDDYKIVKVQAVDMFPQTHHVENVVLLEKR